MSFYPDQVPRFSGSQIDIVERTIDWVHRTVVRALPPEQWIRERFLKRSIGEVIEDGFTLAYMPCLDRCLVTSVVLRFHGIDSYILLHDTPGGMWHFVLELQHEGNPWVWADYSSFESRLFDGRYRYAQVPGVVPRFLRIGGPECGSRIWSSRPPLRFLVGMGVDLSMRYQRFCELRDSYEKKVSSGRYTLGDHLVRRPEESVWAELWSTHPVVEACSDRARYTDLSNVHIYLESASGEKS